MSNNATHWAVNQRGLKPAAKVVLWHLADRHHKDYGCFPSQQRLAEDCEMSRSTVNEHLNTLEAKGLIRRERRINAITRRQESTRYFLAFEEGFSVLGPRPVSGHGAVSEKPEKPCPENVESRVRNPDTNSVREPLREPAREKRQPTESVDEAKGEENFQLFLQAHPKPRNRHRSLELWRAAEKSGVQTQRIISAARRYRERTAAQNGQYLAASDTWLERRAWEEEDVSAAQPDPGMGLAAFWADTIRKGGRVPASAIKPSLARDMVSAGLIEAEELRRIGVTL